MPPGKQTTQDFRGPPPAAMARTLVVGELCDCRQRAYNAVTAWVFALRKALELRHENAPCQQACAASASSGGKRNRGTDLSATHQMCDFEQAASLPRTLLSSSVKCYYNNGLYWKKSGKRYMIKSR